MTVKLPNTREYRHDAFFISLRTHFNFFKRFITYFVSFSSFFTQVFVAFFQSIPFLNTALNFTTHLLDSLSFGTNSNNSTLSKTIAFVGYGSLIVMGIISQIYPALISPVLIPGLALILGLYFEGVTILAWFNNYKTLSDEKMTGEYVEPRRLDNARIMFYAAVITFASMLFKSFALTLSATFPAAALSIFIIAQLAETCAILGSIGKETVNFSRNHHFWTTTPEDDLQKEMEMKMMKPQKSYSIEKEPIKQGSANHSHKFLMEKLVIGHEHEKKSRLPPLEERPLPLADFAPDFNPIKPKLFPNDKVDLAHDFWLQKEEHDDQVLAINHLPYN